MAKGSEAAPPAPLMKQVFLASQLFFQQSHPRIHLGRAELACKATKLLWLREKTSEPVGVLSACLIDTGFKNVRTWNCCQFSLSINRTVLCFLIVMQKIQDKSTGTVTKAKTHRKILNEGDGIVYLSVTFNVLHMEQNLFKSVSKFVAL